MRRETAGILNIKRWKKRERESDEKSEARHSGERKPMVRPRSALGISKIVHMDGGMVSVTWSWCLADARRTGTGDHWLRDLEP